MFQGSIPALVTPMTETGDVDFPAYERFVDWQVCEGSHGLVPVGTTGESATLDEGEKHDVIRCCVEVAAGRVPVIAGTGYNDTRKTIALTTFAEECGVDAALVVAPYYNKPSQDGLFAHFKAVHDATNIPIIVYNIPGRSVVDISDETMARLAELPRIVGVKDATGNLERVCSQRQVCGHDFLLISGEDATAVGFNAMGGRGAISVTANVAPKLCSDMQNATLAGDFASARVLQDKLFPLHQAMFCEPSPAPAKYALSRLGRMQTSVRLPLLSLSENGKKQVDAAIAHAGLAVIE